MQGVLLGCRAGVGVSTFGCKPALVADADRVLVVVAGMCPRQILVACLIQLSVTGDVVVVAGEPEAGVVTGDEVLDREPTVV